MRNGGVHTDIGGLAVTTSAPVAFEHYERALDSLLSGRDTVEEHATRAVAEDDDLAVAWLVLGLHHRLTARMPESRQCLERAMRHPERRSEREASLLRFFGLFLAQDLRGAEAAGVEHLRRYPTDHLVVMFVHFLYNIMLPDMNRRDRHLALARELAPAWRNDWYLLGALAFVESEAGNHGLSRDLAERALDQRPDSAGATHAMAHALLETGAVDEGQSWLRAWLSEWGAGALPACHLTWHLALLHLAAGDGVAVATNLDEITAYAGRAMSALTDGASLMWRLHLDDPATPLPWEALAEMQAPPGFTFGELHRGFVLGGLGRLDDLVRHADTISPVAGDACRAVADFEAGDYARAAKRLVDREVELVTIGGSRAQLEVLEDTMIAALARSGRGAEAAVRLRGRLDQRHSARDRRWLAAIA